MARYFAAQGNGFLNRTSADNSPSAWKKWPFAVLIGPSGQLVQLNPPSGIAGKTPSPTTVRAWHSHEASLNHSAVAWKRRRLLFMFSDSINTGGSMRAFVWNPQPQEARKVNPAASVNVDTNTNVRDLVIADGTHWELWNTYKNSPRDFLVMMPIYDGVLWVKKDTEATHFGVYKGNIPYKLSTSGYFWGSTGEYGNLGDGGDEGWSRLPGSNGAGGFVMVQGGIDFRDPGAYPANYSHCMCEMVRHNDTFYIVSQGFVQAMTIGCKGNYIHHDYGVDDLVAVGAITGYQQRNENDTLGSTMRSMTVHSDKVWMLTNRGKVYEVRPGGLIERADLTQIGTPWASGIAGGQMDRQGTSTWPGASNYRPLLRSFNGKLHAFLNFRTTFRVAAGKGVAVSKTQGRGIAWFTSVDGNSWQDRSEMLPASGIQTPSGNHVFLNTWLAEINPFRHSAYMNTNYPSGYGPKAPVTNHLGESAPMTQGPLGHPSGFKQAGFLPFWSSGNLLDDPGTKFNLLKTALQYGVLSGCLFPTLVSYPSGYAFVNPSGFDQFGYLPQVSGGVWEPIPGGANGYDYTGCDNYHIGGWTDDDDPNDKKLVLYFSRNFDGSTSLPNNRQVPTLFYTLTESSGFIQRNEAWLAGQLNGFTPIELYDPEVIVPSGDIYNPNPRIDTINKRVRLDFILADWFFWELTNVKVQYSLDGGQGWANATISGASTSLNTGTALTDPSGQGITAAQRHTVYWLYEQDVGKNSFLPRAQLRIRAETG